MNKKLLGLCFVVSLICVAEIQPITGTLARGFSTMAAMSTGATTNAVFRNHRGKANLGAALMIAGLNHLMYGEQPKVVWFGYGVGACSGMICRKTVDLFLNIAHQIWTKA